MTLFSQETLSSLVFVNLHIHKKSTKPIMFPKLSKTLQQP